MCTFYCAVVVVALVITVESPKPSATSSPVPTTGTGNCTGAVLALTKASAATNSLKETWLVIRSYCMPAYK